MKKFLKQLEPQIQEGLHGAGCFGLIRVGPLLIGPNRANLDPILIKGRKKRPFERFLLLCFCFGLESFDIEFGNEFVVGGFGD